MTWYKGKGSEMGNILNIFLIIHESQTLWNLTFKISGFLRVWFRIPAVFKTYCCSDNEVKNLLFTAPSIFEDIATLPNLTRHPEIRKSASNLPTKAAPKTFCPNSSWQRCLKIRRKSLKRMRRIKFRAKIIFTFSLRRIISRTWKETRFWMRQSK